MLNYLASRLLPPQTSVHRGPHTFHSFVTSAGDADLDASHGPQWLLPDLLLQILRHLDTQTLCTSVPLVCKAWREAAGSRQIWAARIDPAVLDLLQLGPSSGTASADSLSYFYLAPPDAALSCTSSSGNSSGSSSNSDNSAPGHQPAAPAAPAPAALAVRLPLLHHALYSRNLLRNPLFQALCNSDRKMRTMRPASSGAFHGLPTGVFTSQQRRLAWVTTVGDHGPQGLRWECPPYGVPAGIASPHLPLPALATSSSSTAAAGLQSWLRSLKAPSAAAAAAVGCPAADVPAATAAGAAAASRSAAVSCLSTPGSSWGEVVQVVDLLEELTQRGISPDLAAALLDTGSLALGLSCWVAAPAAAATDTAAMAGGMAAVTTAAAAGSEAAWSGFTAATAVNAAAGQRQQQQQQQQQQAPQEPPGSHRPQFAAALMLDDGQVPLRSFQTFVRRASSHHFFSSRLAVPAGNWHRYAYLLPACPPGCRRAVVLLRGRGPQQPHPHQQSTQPQQPPGGVKFACAQLAFVKQSEAAAFGAEECLAGWACGRPL